MKILCTGDLHLGRRSSRLPERFDARTHSAASCWERIVDLALGEGVDVVVLSGDLVDRANRFYEAVGPLEAGLRRLAGAGITTVAVAGNHDFDVLPRLADSLSGSLPGSPAGSYAGSHSGSYPGPHSGSLSGGLSDSLDAPGSFHLLGRGGSWERVTVRRGDRVLHIDGWSFPEQYVRESPVASYDLAVPDDGPVLGLLHADLGAPGSPYAPVSLPELRARAVDFWLLGHIHVPYLHEGPGLAPVLYPGSPQALDPGEVGAHGVWLLTLEPGRRFNARLISLSTVRYDEVVVDLTDAADTGEVDARVVEGVRAHLATVEGGGALRCVSCRLRVIGRTPVHRQLAAHLESLIPDLELQDGGATALVERVEIATRPARDLAELARGKDHVGILAGLLMALETEPLRAEAIGAEALESAGLDTRGLDPEWNRLIRDAERAAEEVCRARAYIGLTDGGRGGGEPASPSVAQRALAHQASLLLDLLLAQKEEG